jgi:hypothetical protein
MTEKLTYLARLLVKLPLMRYEIGLIDNSARSLVCMNLNVLDVENNIVED